MMFRRENNLPHFWQWDTEQRLIIGDSSITEIHFCNRTDQCSLVCEVYQENNQSYVNVPNILLQTDWKIRVYAYDSNHTKYEACFAVKTRTKPADYVYTETELKNYADLEERLTALEENAVPEELVKDAVESYLEENPVETGATAEEAAQIAANAAAIKELQEKEVDLTGYATEEYVNSAIGAIEIPEVDLTGYATEQYVNNAIANLPTGGGSEWRMLSSITLEEETMSVSIDKDSDGNSFGVNEISVFCSVVAGSSAASGGIVCTFNNKLEITNLNAMPASYTSKSWIDYNRITGRVNFVAAKSSGASTMTRLNDQALLSEPINSVKLSATKYFGVGSVFTLYGK